MTADGMPALRVAISGAGRMGARHARIFDELADTEVSVIHDPRPAAECDLPAHLQRRCTRSYQAFLEQARRADMAVVAGPTATHFGVARDLMACGLPCLVEKPMTVRPRECLMLDRMARARGIGLYCAHVERFNPALRATADVLRDWQWEAVSLTRQNPGSARLSGDSIVTDLMIHDLDIVQHVMGLTFDALLTVEGGTDEQGHAVGEGASHVTVRLQGDAGYPVTLNTGRLPDAPVRAIHARGAQGSLHVDLLNACHHLESNEGVTSPMPVVSDAEDALTRQARAMIKSVMDGHAHGLASARESWQTLTLCHLIEQRLRLSAHRDIRLH